MSCSVNSHAPLPDCPKRRVEIHIIEHAVKELPAWLVLRRRQRLGKLLLNRLPLGPFVQGRCVLFGALQRPCFPPQVSARHIRAAAAAEIPLLLPPWRRQIAEHTGS